MSNQGPNKRTFRGAVKIDRESLVTEFLHANPTEGIQRSIIYSKEDYVTTDIFNEERTASQQSLAGTKEINKFKEPNQTGNTITGIAKDMGRRIGSFCFPNEKNNFITITCLNENNELVTINFNLKGPLKELDFGEYSRAHYAPFVALYIARQMEAKDLEKAATEPTSDRNSFLPATDDYQFLAEKLLTPPQGYLGATGAIFQEDLGLSNNDQIMGYSCDLTKIAIIYDTDANTIQYDIHNVNYALSTMNEEGSTTVLYNANNQGIAASSQKPQEQAGAIGLAFTSLKNEDQSKNPMDHAFEKNAAHVVRFDKQKEDGISGTFQPIASKRVSFAVTPGPALDPPHIQIDLYSDEIQQKKFIQQETSSKIQKRPTGLFKSFSFQSRSKEESPTTRSSMRNIFKK